MQAEFGVADGGFIEVDGYSYSRHDVFEKIENPEFPTRFNFHKRIWNSPELLQLLENNALSTTLASELVPLMNNRDFYAFFSPYFAGPFNYLSRTLIAETELNELGKLLKFEQFLLADEREEAFRPIRIFLDENQKILRNVNAENYKILRPKFALWVDSEWFSFFNNLPDEFYEVKNEIAVRLINIGVAVQKTRSRDCRKVSEQLVLINDVPESLRNLISSNHAAYMQPRKTRISVGWRSGWWILWVVIGLARASANGCGDNTTFHEKPYNFEHRYLAPDSVFKIVRDSAVDGKSDTRVKSIDLKPHTAARPVIVAPDTTRTRYFR